MKEEFPTGSSVGIGKAGDISQIDGGMLSSLDWLSMEVLK